MYYGISEQQIKEIIQAELNKNPDLQYYINNPYLDELIDLLIDGICAAIARSGEKIIESIEDSRRRLF